MKRKKEIRIIGKKLTNQLIEGVKNEHLVYNECEFIDCTFAPYSADKPVSFCCCEFRSGQEIIKRKDEGDKNGTKQK